MLNKLSKKSLLSAPRLAKPHLGRSIMFSDSGEVSAADPRAIRALVALMDMEAVIGGAASHFGGPSALAEINSALHAYCFQKAEKWMDHFNLINDAGHCENGLYALKALYQFADLKVEDLKKFRSIESKLTGHGEAHLFPDGVQLSNGPLGSSVGQAQGLALGDKLVGNNRVTVLTLSDGGAMEGEAREALAAIPGMAAKGELNPFVLIISDNNTKLSHRIDEDSFSMRPTFDTLNTLGWNVFMDIDGHNLEVAAKHIEEGITAAKKNPHKPVCLHFKTIKGYGYKKAEDSASGGHGFPIKDPKDLRAMVSEIYAGETLPEMIDAWLTDLENREKASTSPAPAVKKEKIQVGVASALIELKKEGFPIVSVSSDLYGSTGLAAFRKEFPESSFDVGIAESNMVSVGAGLSKVGLIPIVDTFSQFGVTKGALPLIMANLSQAPVIAVFSHTGFQDAADGASHQSLTYFSKVASIPHLRVISLSCSSEAHALMKEVVREFQEDVNAGKTPPSTVFFLGRENFPQHYVGESSNYSTREEVVLSESSSAKATILTTGSLVPQALRAQETLKEKGVEVNVVSKSWINGPFTEKFKSLLESSGGKLIVAEDHQRIAGFGAHALNKLTEQFGVGLVEDFRHLAVDGAFGRSAYKADHLYELHKIDGSAIAEAVLN